MWIKRWKDLIGVIKTMKSDDSFEMSSLHKMVDGMILLWDKKR